MSASQPEPLPLAPAETSSALTFAGVTVHGDAPPSGEAKRILHGVDWEVRRGEHWAILGPNGAGKSTLLRTAAGVLEPSSGTVTALGDSFAATGLRNPRLRIGVLGPLAQRFAAQLTALELVIARSAGPAAMLGQPTRPADVERARALLAIFGCTELADRRVRDCSVGERQRILLARTLMRDPELVLFDEPTTGLDLPGREELLQAMARLAAERPDLATVTVTHHVEELASSTTHAMLLRDGAVVAAGDAAATVTEERLSECFGVGVSLSRTDGRWSARAVRPGW